MAKKISFANRAGAAKESERLGWNGKTGMQLHSIHWKGWPTQYREREIEMSKTKFRPDRLLKLATHLEVGKLGHKRFDFGGYNYGKGADVGCGTNGCAIGECPILFKRHWKFKFGFAKLKVGSGATINDASSFFGIELDHAQSLFFPRDSCFLVVDVPWNSDGLRLPRSATRLQVAAAIRRFVKWKLKQIEAGKGVQR